MQPQTGWTPSSSASPQSVSAANIASHCAQQPPFISIVGASTQANIAPTAVPGFAFRVSASFKTASAAAVWQTMSTSLTAYNCEKFSSREISAITIR